MVSEKLRVLSIDGGGMHNVFSAAVISHLESLLIQQTKNPNARIADYFDVVIGCNTGGLLGCFYLMPQTAKSRFKPNALYSAQEVLNFILAEGYTFYDASKNNSWLGLRKFFNPFIYSSAQQELVLENWLRSAHLPVLLKPMVLPAYNITQGKEVLIHSETPKINSLPLKKILPILWATPPLFAPFVLETYTEGSHEEWVDGSMLMPNPGLQAIQYLKQVIDPCIQPENILLLSIGGGGVKTVKYTGQWGNLNDKYVNSGTVDKELSTWFQSHKTQGYLRVEIPEIIKPTLAETTNTSIRAVQKLKQAAEMVIEDMDKTKTGSLKGFAKLLIENQQ